MNTFKNTSGKGILGAIIAAIVASACCVGPLVLLGLGAGGAWIGNLTALEPYRPVFMGLSLIFLIYAFYRVYRKPKAESCEPGSYCANPRSDTINKISLWVVTAIIIGLLAFPYLTPYLYSQNSLPKNGNYSATTITQAMQGKAKVCESCAPFQKSASSKSGLKKVILEIPSMHCPACPVTVSKSLLKIDGVDEADADLETKKVVVVYDSTKVDINQIKEATLKVGYPAVVLSKNK